MSEPRPEIRARAAKNHSEMLRMLRFVTQKRAAELIEASETWVSRLHDGELMRFASLLAALGLKVVPEGQRTYPPERIAALTTLAREALNNDGAASSFGEQPE
jgi:hypothetical protein